MSRGFTLIEILIASLIMVLFSSFLFYMTTSSMQGIKSSNEYLISVLKTSSIMEDIKDSSFNDVLSLNGNNFDNEKGVIFVKQVGPAIYEITMEHVWNNKRKPVKLITFRSKY